MEEPAELSDYLPLSFTSPKEQEYVAGASATVAGDHLRSAADPVLCQNSALLKWTTNQQLRRP